MTVFETVYPSWDFEVKMKSPALNELNEAFDDLISGKSIRTILTFE